METKKEEIKQGKTTGELQQMAEELVNNNFNGLSMHEAHTVLSLARSVVDQKSIVEV